MTTSTPPTTSAPQKPGELFQEALYLANNGEHERANAILVECVIADPGDPDFVEEFLANLHQQHRPASAPPAASAALDAPAPSVTAISAEQEAELAREVEAKNWAAVRRIGPSLLSLNPWHAPTLTALAKAAEAAQDYEVEICYLRQALSVAPLDLELNRRGGNSLARMRQYDPSLACWRQVADLAPDDDEAPRQIARLTVEKNRNQAGLEIVSADWSTVIARRRQRRPAAPKPAAAAPAAKGRPNWDSGLAHDSKLSPIQKLELAVREFPFNPDLYLQLTPLYLEKGRDFDAEKLLAAGKETTDKDPRVCQLWEDVTMMRLDKKVAAAQNRVKEKDSPEAQSELADALSRRDRLETEIYVQRCKRDPNNAAMRLQLGLRLTRVGKATEARPHFDAALLDKDLKCAAAYEIAVCCQQSAEFPLAIRYFRMAADSATQPGQMETKKLALYQASEMSAKIKLFKLARRYLSGVVKIDPEYRDTPERMSEIVRQLG